MKNKKFTAVVIGAALLANMSVFSLASAATSASTQTNQSVTAGALSIDNSPTIANFAAVNVSVSAQNTNTRSTAVRISDTRGIIGGGGFTLTQTANDFTNPVVNKSIGVANLTVSSSGISDRVAVSGSDCTNDNNTGLGANSTSMTFSATAGGAMDGGTPAIYSSDPKNLVNAPASAAGTSRVLTCDVFSQMDLVVPAFTAGATYTSTVVFSIQ